MKKMILMLGLLAIFTASAYSQINNWENVRSLPGDQRVVVETTQGKKINGKFQSADDDKMSLKKSGKAISFNKADIKRVYLGKRSSSLLGGIIGGVGGFFAGGFIAAGIYNQGDRRGDGLEGLVGAVPGAVAGAVVGRKVGGRIKQKQLIYEAY